MVNNDDLKNQSINIVYKLFQYLVNSLYLNDYILIKL